MNISWFPGHMAKARRLIEEHLKLVDAVCELVDARAPEVSRNPELSSMIGKKPRLLALNRADQADPSGNSAWAAFYRSGGGAVMECDSKSGAGVSRFVPEVKTLLKNKIEADVARGQPGRALRVMIVGIPNVGKSSFINRLMGRRVAAAEDRPGVTRSRQWARLAGGLELLDTPGVLWPKFEDEQTGLLLAYTGAIRDEIMDMETLAACLIEHLQGAYPGLFATRYRLDCHGDPDGAELLALAALSRGYLVSGGLPDTERMAKVLLGDFRGGKLGRITLQLPPAKTVGVEC